MSTHQDPGGNILVVDDNARARESVADILRHAGHSARCCASAAEALSRKDLSEYDLIITDLRMPGMTGLDFIRELESRHLDAQIIMVTAHASVATAVEAVMCMRMLTPTSTLWWTIGFHGGTKPSVDSTAWGQTCSVQLAKTSF